MIIGGGITGLSAAWRLHKVGMPFMLLESGARVGGKVLALQEGGFTLELGADAFLTRKPWALELAREVGSTHEIQFAARTPISTYVLHRGRAVPLPEGFALLAPTRWGPFLRSPLFSARGKLRATMDVALPRRHGGEDESLASFVTRRLGRELLDRAAEPMMAGIFNAPAERLSMRAAFGHFMELERKHGSVIRGLRAARRSEREAASPFFSFRSGAGALASALARRLHDAVRTNASVERISAANGGHFLVTLRTGERISAGALILATPAHVSACLLRDVAPTAAGRLADIGHSGIGSLHLAFRREYVGHPLDAYGLVIPRAARRFIDGVTFASSKFAGRAPEGHVLLRIFFGGVHTRHALDLDDESLVTAACDQLGPVLHLRGRPVLTRIHRWPDAYPQYDLDHLRRVEAIESSLPPRVAVAGCALGGVGVPDCIRQGHDAAASICGQISGRRA